MEEEEEPRWLLVSDVDDTLAGDEGGLADFAREGGGVLLVLNSSRPRESVLRTVEGFPAGLRVDGVITALGTEILWQGEDLAEWTRGFSGWNRWPVDKLMEREGMRAHPQEMQTVFKASFSVPRARWEDLQAAVLAAAPESRVIVSGESDFDVIPAAAGKDRATLWMAERLGVPPERLVVSGDSANDLAMFQAAPRAIAVGNARRELLERADPHRTYFARGERARGILEGLRHWGAISRT